MLRERFIINLNGGYAGYRYSDERVHARLFLRDARVDLVPDVGHRVESRPRGRAKKAR